MEDSLNILTVSFWPDACRCLLLYESILKFGKGKINWYLVVDDEDYERFLGLFKKRWKPILIKKSKIVGKEAYQELERKGWLLQQFVKILFAREFEGRSYVNVDSDVFFCNQFSYKDFFKDNKIYLNKRMYKTGGKVNLNVFRFYKSQKLIFGKIIKRTYSKAPTYMGPLIMWDSKLVKEIISLIEKKYKLSFIDAILENLEFGWEFSEYFLYGVFLEEYKKCKFIIKNNLEISHCIYHTGVDPNKVLLDKDEIRDKIAILVQSNCDINPRLYCDIINIDSKTKRKIGLIYQPKGINIKKILEEQKKLMMVD